MPLLQFHFQCSILCMLTTFGFLGIFLKKIKENGWGIQAKGGPFKRFFLRMRGYFYFALVSFVPIVNFLTPLVLYYMARHKPPTKEAI